MRDTLQGVWRRILLVVLPAIAFSCLIAALEASTATGLRRYDLYFYGAGSVAYSLAFVLLLLKRNDRPIFLLIMVFSCLSLITKYALTLHFTPGDRVAAAIAGGMLWLNPVVAFATVNNLFRSYWRLCLFLVGSLTVISVAYFFIHLRHQGLSEALSVIMQLLVGSWVTLYGVNTYLQQKERYFQQLGQLDALQALAYTDPLTQLPNRNKLEQFIQDHITRTQAPLSVLLLDIDQFKNLNDALGHEQGDELLKRVGRTLQRFSGPQLLVARIGGDEFVLAGTFLEGDAAEELARYSLLGALGRETAGGSLTRAGAEQLTWSIGISTYPTDALTASSLLRHADTAMLAVKQKGRGSVKRYNRQDDAAAEFRRLLSHDLGHALERRELFMLFQPLVDLHSGKVVKLEALIRWQHPAHGLISPGVFIPLAEQNGSIHALGLWAIQHSLEWAARWPSVHMSVNLSSYQLLHPDFLPQLKHMLQSSPAAAQLELELTETAMMSETDQTWDVLLALRDLGLPLLIDDFGTGYSSISRILSMPIQGVKIDRSLISGLQGDSRQPLSHSVIKAIVQISRLLHFTVTAEGIESQEQALALRELGCDLGQGYYFSRPQRPTELDALIQAGYPIGSGRPVY